MNAIQIIKGKKLFVLIETLYGVCNSTYAQEISELPSQLRYNILFSRKGVVQLPTIHTSDKEVCRIADTIHLN